LAELSSWTLGLRQKPVLWSRDKDALRINSDMIGAQNFLDHATSSIIHQEDSKENNYSYFNRFNPQIQYSFMNLRGFVEKSGEGLG